MVKTKRDADANIRYIYILAYILHKQITSSGLESWVCLLHNSRKNDNIEYRHLIERSNIQHIITALKTDIPLQKVSSLSSIALQHDRSEYHLSLCTHPPSLAWAMSPNTGSRISSSALPFPISLILLVPEETKKGFFLYFCSLFQVQILEHFHSESAM